MAQPHVLCLQYVVQYSFIWTVSHSCRYTIGYIIGAFESQVVILVVVVPVQLNPFACFSEESVRVLPSFDVLCYRTVFLQTVYLLS